MTVKIPSIILNSDGSRSLNKPSFDITFSGTAETKRRCNMFSLLRYFWLALSRADENVMSNRSAKIGVNREYAMCNKSLVRMANSHRTVQGSAEECGGDVDAEIALNAPLDGAIPFPTSPKSTRLNTM
jgi:hypothetical protein